MNPFWKFIWCLALGIAAPWAYATDPAFRYVVKKRMSLDQQIGLAITTVAMWTLIIGILVWGYFQCTH